MSDERDMIIEQRNLLLSNMATFYPHARQGNSYYRMMLTCFPEYSRRHALRDLAYLQDKGYIERRAKHGRKPEPGEVWSESYWVLTAKGFEIAQQILTDPALEV